MTFTIVKFKLNLFTKNAIERRLFFTAIGIAATARKSS
ncbi:hypothetical protein N483_14130 [Pseudoalteromonas luteoviolacea NCIMB 1944]|uniref:Uncharacterized protein n=1 Tax=Pseudoalteromonas luteoviolacea (strain 2ta16) TaxID=1353533 RepID=V4GZK1_PSEL2|nr:hypothetical protein PL2TA16_01725 [Pseudoalteromonas luteoviolacea 2ta16]KZN41805.1 hypothetical protein N483_14130 [Pseudoalteromonas luteoviolacea NCIMB 1944]